VSAPQFVERCKTPDRKDHLWAKVPDGPGFKCVLCGAVTPTRPPSYPTPGDWMPARYERLTDQDRSLGDR